MTFDPGCDAGTVHGEVLTAAARWGGRVFQRVHGSRESATYTKFRDAVLDVARALVALGLEKGDRVAIVADNSPRWLVADIAVMAAGGIVVPRSASAPQREVEIIAAHCACRFAFVADVAAFSRYVGALCGVKTVVLFEGDARGALSWDAMLARSSSAPLPSVSPQDVATIVYTSGTTGRPKGVTLAHRNVIANLRALADALPIEPGHVFVSVLPSWHMYERTVEYYVASRGAVLTYTGLSRLRSALAHERPHLIVGVPRIWEKIHDGVTHRLRESPWFSRVLGQMALRGSLACTRSRLSLRGLTEQSVGARTPRRLLSLPGLAAWPLHLAAERLIYRRLRTLTGGRLVAAVCAGAAIPPHLDLFFAAAGVPLVVGYGLTETSPVIALRRLERNVIGTIGVPLAGTEVRLLDAQPRRAGASGAATHAAALEVRGPQVMLGYWDDPAATSAVLSPDGWFQTGDLIRLTVAGDLVFCGRTKDTIVLSGGENVEPEAVEQAALASPLVAQLVVVGQDRKSLGALVWPDPDAPGARNLVRLRGELDARTGPASGLRPWERIRCVALLPAPLCVADGTLTATLKVRRTEVARRHAALIDAMYAG